MAALESSQLYQDFCFCCCPSSEHWRNLLNPISDHVTPLLWTDQRLPSHFLDHCALLRDQRPPRPLLTLLRHAGCLPAILATCQVSSFLRTPLPQVPGWPSPSCHSGPRGTSSSGRKPGYQPHPLFHHICPHKNGSPGKAGPCPTVAQALTNTCVYQTHKKI